MSYTRELCRWRRASRRRDGDRLQISRGLDRRRRLGICLCRPLDGASRISVCGFSEDQRARCDHRRRRRLKRARRLLGSHDPARPRRRELQILTRANTSCALQLSPQPSSPVCARAGIRLRRDAHSKTVTPCRSISTTQPTRKRRVRGSRAVAAPLVLIAALFLSFVPLVGFTTTAALACACGCSVFDVGGLDLPQEQDHGGRVFFEYLERRSDAELCRQLQSAGRSQHRTKKSTRSGTMSASATTSIAIGA